MVNEIVCNGLEIIFGIWVLNMFCDLFLGFDFIEIIQELISNKLNKGKDNDKNV